MNKVFKVGDNVKATVPTSAGKHTYYGFVSRVMTTDVNVIYAVDIVTAAGSYTQYFYADEIVCIG